MADLNENTQWTREQPLLVDNRTTNRSYLKPYPDNPIVYDCNRIGAALESIDADMTELAGKVNNGLPAALLAAIGGEDFAYSESKTYDVGDYCNKDNKLYRCIVAIEINEEWNAVHWAEANILDELARLRIEIQAIANSLHVREQFTLTEDDVAAKYITLNNPARGIVNLSVQGVAQFYGEDFTVAGNILSWDGLGLETVGGEGLRAGDKFIVEYTKG